MHDYAGRRPYSLHSRRRVGYDTEETARRKTPEQSGSRFNFEPNLQPNFLPYSPCLFVGAEFEAQLLIRFNGRGGPWSV